MPASIKLPKPPQDDESQLRKYEHLYKHQVGMFWLSVLRRIGVLREAWATKLVVRKMVNQTLNARKAARLAEIYWESVVNMIDAYIDHISKVDLKDLPEESASVQSLIEAKKTEKAVIGLHLVALRSEIAFYEVYCQRLETEVGAKIPEVVLTPNPPASVKSQVLFNIPQMKKV
jgi:hypothetical protein